MSFSTLKGRFRPFALCDCESNRLDGKIFQFFDRLLRIFFAEHNIVLINSRTGYCLGKFYSGTGYHFQEFDSGTAWLFRFSSGTSPYVRRPNTPSPLGLRHSRQPRLEIDFSFDVISSILSITVHSMRLYVIILSAYYDRLYTQRY